MTDKRERVLIIESDPAVSENITEFLDNLGYYSEVVLDADTIVDKLQSGHYDLLLIDQHCLTDKPKMALRNIHDYDHTIDTVVMFNTPTVDLLLELSHEGVTKFITKPFTSKELDKTVAKGINCTKQNREFKIYSENRDEFLTLLKTKSTGENSPKEIEKV